LIGPQKSGFSSPIPISTGDNQGLPQFDCPEGEKTAEAVVHGLLKLLFATEISLRGENGCVSQEELDLFDFPAVYMA
jgi:hypothetical protein